jgi:ubiquinone biosynthesis protein UbiJ
MSTPALLCAALEVALNRTLALEPAALALCQTLSGRVMALRCTAPDWCFILEFHPAGVRVLGDDALPAQVTVSGSLGQLLGLAWRRAQGQSSLPQGLRVEGDVDLLHQFNQLLARVDVDLEELLVPYLGDLPAHRAGQWAQQLFGWGRQAAGTLALDTAEYLREETGDLARAADVADWLDGVERLRDGVARLEARLQRLERA